MKLSKILSRSNRFRLLRLKSRLNGKYIPGELPFTWDTTIYNRSAVISKVIGLIGATSYLEIGCFTDAVFKAIDCKHKVGVDPARGGTVRATSDDFFASNRETFDVIFVDGLHTYEQVRVDLLNSFKVLNEGGVILMHDCLPLNYDEQAIPCQSKAWTGDVWKAAFEFKQNPDIDMRIIVLDHGVGILKSCKNTQLKSFSTDNFADLDFNFFQQKYEELGLMEYDDVEDFVRQK